MTTKAPSSVKAAPADALETVAYGAVAGLPAADPHDLDRLGYALYLWLRHRRDPLELAVKTAGARIRLSDEETLKRIRTALQERGVQL
jgi:hypothetical protein